VEYVNTNFSKSYEQYAYTTVDLPSAWRFFMQAASSLRFMYPPLAAPILLVGYHGLLFEALAPYFILPKRPFDYM